MSMKHTAKLVVAAAGLAFVATSAFADEVTLNAQTALPTQHALSQSFIQNFVQPLNKDEADGVKIRLLGGPEVNPADRAPQALQRGVIDMLFIPAAYLAGLVPQAQAMMLQNVGVDKLHKDGAFDYYGKIFQDRLGAHLLAWSETGPNSGYYLYTTKKPKMKDGVVDLSGLSLRTTGAYRPMQNALNATTVQIASGDVPTGLDRGVIEGFGWPTVGLASIGLANRVDYRIEPAFYSLADVVLVSQRKWDRLSDQAKTTLQKMASKYEQTSIEQITRQNKRDIEAANKAGVKAITMKGDAASKYLSIASEAMWNRVGQNVDKDELSKLRNMLYQQPQQ
ncbi:TRAP transporter substrate-binding protein DctP [Pararhizobium mangrovi]|uniref:C4-dicarboxylate ABC transporter substrate-binding protein n=1 Tax=Pararhizobium mangrovi TaxID=2590452 RepID=A0A506U3S6_9HYPH|nr:TRAP transporter substrate-binding protein DctP [Pararhizobium mangrovi]TPW28992.1 hypothetical protein FJU11_08405 [Pararhizobium mangrovi]